MLHITSLSVQDRLNQEGRSQAFVMEIAGPHNQGEFVVEIDEAAYGRLLKVYEAVTGKSSFGSPQVLPEQSAVPQSPVPGVTEEEITNIQAMLLEEENRVVSSKEIGGAPQQFAGKSIGPAEAAMLQGIGMDINQQSDPSDDVFGSYDDDEDDEGELFADDSDQM